MMLNLWWAKRWVSYLLTGVVTTATFVIMMLSGANMLWAIIVTVLANVLMTIISRKFFIAHPLIDYLEGHGFIVKSIDSTGLIRQFIVQLNPPYLQGKLGDRDVEDVYDRKALFYETTPAEVDGEDTGDEIIIRIPKEKYHTLQFREYVYPVFIWNENLKTFITKDALARLESDTLLDHALLYLIRKVEELNLRLRDFGRYVMDNIKPTWFGIGEFIRKHPLLALLLVLGIITIIVIMFFPSLFQSFVAPATQAVNSAAGTTTSSSAVVQPMG